MAEDVKIKISDADLYGTDALGRWESRRAKLREQRRQQWREELKRLRGLTAERKKEIMEAAKDRIEQKRRRRDDFWD